MTDSTIEPLRAPRQCPECGKPSQRESYPFCSVRCKAVDLNRWLSGAYAIAARGDEQDDHPAPDRDQAPRTP